MLKRLLKIGLAGLVLTLIGAIAGSVYVSRRWQKADALAAQFDLRELNIMPSVSEVFDSRGQRMGRLAGDVRYTIEGENLPKTLVDAVVAREDNRFFQHQGVDYIGIVRAAFRNLRAGAVEEGASTITQQLARNTFTLPENPWERKIVEAALAQRLEKQFSKAQILEAYFNRIYFGDGVFGVETAARIYFGKSAAQVELSDSAILAGMIRSPNRLSPLEARDATLAQRNLVLDAMRRLGSISERQVAAAKAQDVPVTKRRLPVVRQDYAMDGIRRELEILLSPEQQRIGGLKIHTTIDPRLQAIATDLVDTELRAIETTKGFPHPLKSVTKAKDPESVHSEYVQGALVAVENSTGAVRAIVGGRDFADSSYNRALLAQRQIGSTFKPFVYAAAFELGLRPDSPVSDADLVPGEIKGAPSDWSPQNSDMKDAGMQPASWGLVKSRNTMTMRVGNWAGLEQVRKLGENCGVSTEIPALPAIYLGAFESTLAEITSAYTIFANAGIRRQAYLIDRIEDRTGKDIYKAARIERRSLPAAAAWEVHEALVAVTTSGTAATMASDGFDLPAAGKTGTTDDFKDAWFVGYTSDLTCGVWVGLDRPQTIMKRGYGSALALPIWVSFMKKSVERDYAATPFKYSGPTQTVSVCSAGGQLATEGCQVAGTTVEKNVPEGTAPRALCPQHRVALATLPADSAFPPMLEEGIEVRPALPVTPSGMEQRFEAGANGQIRVRHRDGGMTIFNGEPR